MKSTLLLLCDLIISRKNYGVKHDIDCLLFKEVNAIYFHKKIKVATLDERSSRLQLLLI